MTGIAETTMVKVTIDGREMVERLSLPLTRPFSTFVVIVISLFLHYVTILT